MSGVAWWLWALAVVGGFALGTVVITLFFSLGRRPARLRVHDPPPLESDAFLRSLAGILNLPIRRGGTVRLLHNGDAFYPRMLDAIRGARRSINLTCYIWERGRVSDAFVAALIERANAGIGVRLLLDSFGGLRAPFRDLRRLRAAGGKVAHFRSFEFGKILRFHKRNHRRAIIIDGEIAFTGGAAIADKWSGNAEDPDHWRDTMIEATGSMAASLQSAFVDIWDYAGKEILTGDAHFPAIRDAAEDDRDAPRHLHVASSPASDEHPLRTFFLLTFCAARERLWITSPYFVPDSFSRRVLAGRARAGVDVRVLLPNEHSDAKPIRQTSHHYYEELLSAGVRIFEFQPTFIHAKLLVADSIWSIIGSANMDIRSKELNKENVIGIHDRALALELEQTFLCDLERSREIHYDEWRRRSFAKRMLERGCAVFAEQY
jgi:cardiolipin synthase A/B